MRETITRVSGPGWRMDAAKRAVLDAVNAGNRTVADVSKATGFNAAKVRTVAFKLEEDRALLVERKFRFDAVDNDYFGGKVACKRMYLWFTTKALFEKERAERKAR